MKAYRVKGTTDDVTTCELCGRPELKGTVMLAPLDVDGNEDGDIEYFGTSCAAKAAGWTVREVNAGVKVAKAEAQAAERNRVIAAREAENKAYKAWVAGAYGAELKDAVQKYGVAGLWAQFRAARDTANNAPAKVIDVDAPTTTCPALAEPGNIHLMTSHCIECNAFRMSKMSPDTVESWYHYGNFSQDEYEAYMHAWATSTVRHSARGWAEEPTDHKVVKIVAAIRRHAGIPASAELAA